MATRTQEGRRDYAHSGRDADFGRYRCCLVISRQVNDLRATLSFGRLFLFGQSHNSLLALRHLLGCLFLDTRDFLGLLVKSVFFFVHRACIVFSKQTLQFRLELLVNVARLFRKLLAGPPAYNQIVARPNGKFRQTKLRLEKEAALVRVRQ